MALRAARPHSGRTARAGRSALDAPSLAKVVTGPQGCAPRLWLTVQ
ncbi:hypothetical protein MILUP08_46364 [Micromonospora lupini str. Lupac 08]|uniref:Uncharacterized protein n=1 Tax=Micromonospora lupini str. Lupac 08 TaxID=1150864 RepID=I0LCB8_9ACTN|nr:hypothetical protein MILUP08_46364 [Micromonospora lupini str. Lupac 08]